MEKIKKLANIFAKYKIYSKSKCLKEGTPVSAFLGLYPNNYYSTDLKELLKYQNYEPLQKGADLPWWGRNYFNNKKGYRVVAIAQDSYSIDAGSIVFFASLFYDVSDMGNLKKFIDKIDSRFNAGKFRNGYLKIKKILEGEMGLNKDFLYITDAKKVYKERFREKGKYDKNKSGELLKEEIKFCKPSFIITLGKQAVSLLKEDARGYSELVESNEIIKIQGIDCVVAPFPIGNGVGQNNFNKRKDIALNKIKKLLNREKVSCVVI